MVSYDEILKDLIEKTGLSKKELEKKIKEKFDEFSGLVSLEGASHLVARDLGVSMTIKKRTLKISDLKDGMKNIDIIGRITMITEPREFQRKDGNKGKVSNLFMTDGSGNVRIPIWDKQVDQLKGNVNEGDVIEVKDGLVKMNTFGNLELRVSDFSRIEKMEDDGSIPTDGVAKKQISERVEIKDASEGFHEIKGNLVHLFKINFTYKMCPECRMKLEEDKCAEHGKVKPQSNMILSSILDDGTGSIRTVFFREQAKKISNIDPETLSQIGQEEAYKMLTDSLLGKEITVTGRVKKNKIFENLEIVVNDVHETNPIEEGKRLIYEIKTLG